MTTGTEGPDNLTNDRNVVHETIDALGGDDVITLLPPTTASSAESITVNGGAGFDTLIHDAFYVPGGTATGFDGHIRVREGNGVGYDIFWTSIERLQLSGLIFASSFSLGDEIDILRLSAGRGGATIGTGGGNDEVYMTGNTEGARVTVDGGTGDDLIDFTGLLSNANPPPPHTAHGGEGNDTLKGGEYSDLLGGGAGNDNLQLWVRGAFTDHSILFDTALGGAGNDNFFFGSALSSFDVVTGGAGIDTLVVQGDYAGGLALSANVTEIEGLSMLAGSNTNFGEPGTNSYNYSITTHDANFAAGVQAKVNGAALLATENFTFNGSAETDASFVVYGSRGIDTLTGGFGHDIFFYAENRFQPGDTVNGGPGGYDGIFFRGNYTIDFNAPGYHGLLTSIENMTLSSAADERYARGGGTEFDYNIKLADSHLAAGVTLTVSGALLRATETMVLDGSLETNGFLNIYGGAAGDTLKGGGQADLLHGNLGADFLTGGGGADTFRYQSTAESTFAQSDLILDFTPGSDRIDLSRIDANSFAAGDQAFTWIGSNAFSGTGASSAGELRAYQGGGMWFVQGDTNGDGNADLVIALMPQGPTPLGAGDFLL
ncbi:MAG TPA: calcium-binding protein [Allosphingosinicella sp.]